MFIEKAAGSLRALQGYLEHVVDFYERKMEEDRNGVVGGIYSVTMSEGRIAAYKDVSKIVEGFLGEILSGPQLDDNVNACIGMSFKVRDEKITDTLSGLKEHYNQLLEYEGGNQYLLSDCLVNIEYWENERELHRKAWTQFREWRGF